MKGWLQKGNTVSMAAMIRMITSRRRMKITLWGKSSFAVKWEGGESEENENENYMKVYW